MKKRDLKFNFCGLNFIMTVCIMMGLVMVACGDDDKDEPSSDEGSASTGKWYVSPNGFATASDFAELNTAIDNHEVLSDYGKYGIHYAEVDEFIASDGSYGDTDSNLGRFRFSLKNGCVHFVHIIDDMTAEKYQARLFLDAGKQNTYGRQRMWYFNAGRHFGMMAYYIDFAPEVLVYKKKNNTLVFSNGDIFILSSDGLQGDDGVWKPFTPKF